MRRLILVISVLAVMLSPSRLCAEDVDGAFPSAADSVIPLRPVFAAYTFEAGSSHLADTYLTPLRYTGWHMGLDYMRFQSMKFSPDRWTMRLHVNLSLDKTENPAKNADMWNVMLTAGWGMMHRWHLPWGLTAAAGGAVSLQGGFLYNPRNGNNPVAAKGAFTLDATGYVARPFRLGRTDVTVMYQPSLPVAGAFFSPDYGELYYEIYLGNRSGLAHFAWPGNYFRLDNLLTADIRLGDTSLRVGYRAGIFSSKVNDIVTHIYTHSFVIGVSGEWLSYNPRRGRRSSTLPVASPIL